MLITPTISADSKTEVDFEKQVLPILQNSCFDCHSAPKTDADGNVTEPKGDVQLDSVKGIEESRHGEVIIAGEPEDSLLYQRITLPEGESGIMPPSEEGDPLTEQQTELLRKWIEDGANYGKWKGNQSQHKPSRTESNPHQPTVMPPITSLVFSHDGKSVIACSQAGLHIYDWPTLNLQRMIKVTAHNIHDLAFSPDGNQLAVGGGNPATEGIIEIFSWPEVESLGILKGHRDSVTAVAWRDASSLASGSLDKHIILWDLQTGNPTQQLKGHSKGVSSLCFLNDKEILVSTGIDQSVRVWDLNSGELIRSMNNHTMSVHDLALRPVNGGLPMIASAGDDRTVRFWQPTIGRMVKFARLNIAPLNIAWLKDGSRVVASCVDGSIRIIDVDSVEITDTISALDSWAYSLIIHPTDGSIAIGGANGQVLRIIPK
jgi:WD40 repeat protein